MKVALLEDLAGCIAIQIVECLWPERIGSVFRLETGGFKRYIQSSAHNALGNHLVTNVGQSPGSLEAIDEVLEHGALENLPCALDTGDDRQGVPRQVPKRAETAADLHDDRLGSRLLLGGLIALFPVMELDDDRVELIKGKYRSVR